MQSLLNLTLAAGTSMQWGAWAIVGMAAQSAASLDRIASLGMGVLSPAIGLQALLAILSVAEVIPVHIASPFAFARLLQGRRHIPGIFANVATTTRHPTGRNVASWSVSRQPIYTAPALVRQGLSMEAILAGVRSLVANVLGAEVRPAQ